MSRGTATFTFRMPKETLDLIDSIVERHNQKKPGKTMTRADFVRKCIATAVNEIARKKTKGKRSVVPCSECNMIVPLTPGMESWKNLFGVVEYACPKCMKKMREREKQNEAENAT